MGNLSNIMKERLEKWKKNVLPVPVAQKVKGNYVSRKDFGDDIRDYEKKDQDAWDNEVRNNPIYQNYR